MDRPMAMRRFLGLTAPLLFVLLLSPALARAQDNLEFAPFAPFDTPALQFDPFPAPGYIPYSDDFPVPAPPSVSLPRYKEPGYEKYAPLATPKVSLPPYPGQQYRGFRPMDPLLLEPLPPMEMQPFSPIPPM